jgi:hypothetical protein
MNMSVPYVNYTKEELRKQHWQDSVYMAHEIAKAYQGHQEARYSQYNNALMRDSTRENIEIMLVPEPMTPEQILDLAEKMAIRGKKYLEDIYE